MEIIAYVIKQTGAKRSQIMRTVRSGLKRAKSLSKTALTNYYRKCGSASYIVREVRSVREREIQRERERERERESETEVTSR